MRRPGLSLPGLCARRLDLLMLPGTSGPAVVLPVLLGVKDTISPLEPLSLLASVPSLVGGSTSLDLLLDKASGAAALATSLATRGICVDEDGVCGPMTADLPLGRTSAEGCTRTGWGVSDRIGLVSTGLGATVRT
mmetsp:Transcript_38109/g.99734  ORF Transcript_38109/g.99734 Transcript_38109/m.99734 type:complete len:135 (-) Transcript_38109:542-946(-)